MEFQNHAYLHPNPDAKDFKFYHLELILVLDPVPRDVEVIL